MCRCSFRPTAIQRTEEADPPNSFLHLEATAHIASLVFRPLTLRAFFRASNGSGRHFMFNLAAVPPVGSWLVGSSQGREGDRTADPALSAVHNLSP